MNLSDLANLIAVRNHVIAVMNDVSVTKKSDVRALQELRVSIDKKFVQEVTNVDWLNFRITGNVEPLAEKAVHIPSARNSSVSIGSGQVQVSAAIVEMPEMVTTVTVGGDTKQLHLPFEGKEDVVDSTHSGKILTSEDEELVEDVKDTLESISNGDLEKLDQSLDKLEKQGVTLETVVTHTAIQNTDASDEDKKKVIEKTQQAAKKAKLNESEKDKELDDALKKAKADLKKQGRSNKKKAAKTDDPKE